MERRPLNKGLKEAASGQPIRVIRRSVVYFRFGS